MRKKLFAVLLAIAAAAALTTAAAAEPLSARDIVEQIAVPLAEANDSENCINNMYSAEDLAEIIRVLNENGITFEENSLIMQTATNRHGLYEETVISGICDRVFGRNSEGWTTENRYWYEEQLMKIGALEKHQITVPGPDNMTREEAEAFALSSIRKQYGQNLPLEDRSIWQVRCQFTGKDTNNPNDRWSFRLDPKDIRHGTYVAEFNDSNPEQSVSFLDRLPPDWTKPYTGEEVLTAFYSVYSFAQNSWPQPVWQELHEMMLNAEILPDEADCQACRGYRLTEYPEPEPDEIPREEAIRIAKETLKKERAALDSALLTEYAGERSWLVALTISQPWDGSEEEEAGNWVVAVDSRTGEARSLREAYGEETYVPEKAWERAGEGLTRFEDVVPTAAEALRKAYPELDPLDGQEFAVSGMSGREFTIEFRTKNIRHGDACVRISPDGDVLEVTADMEPLNGDNLFDRYRKVYGYYGDWDQSLWVRLGKDMEKLEPKDAAGKVLKATRYPEESSVKIRHEQARELAIRESGKRRTEVNTCVLADAEPHPVWIMRIISQSGDTVTGIDAETGKTVFKEKYRVDETPVYALYSMPSTRRGIEDALAGAAPTPTPLPDGKPWFWGMDYAPREYWERAEAYMRDHDITQENIYGLGEEWDDAFGNIDFWPQENQAVYSLLLSMEEELYDPDHYYMLFPDPEKKSQDEIEEAARSAIRSLGEAGNGGEQPDSLKASSTLYNDSRNPDRDGENYGRPVWWVWFYRWAAEDQEWSDLAAYAILDEDGNVLKAGLGEI